MLLTILVVILLILKLAPDTPFGKRLHEALVQAPAKWRSAASLRKVALLAVVILAAFFLASLALPPDLSLVAAADLSTYLDLFAAISAGLAVATGRLGLRTLRNLAPQVSQYVGAPLRRVFGARRKRSVRLGLRRPRSPDEGVLALA